MASHPPPPPPWLGWSLVGVALLASLAAYPHTPDPMATHWGLDGQANGYSPRPWGLLLMPALMLVAQLAWSHLPRLRGVAPAPGSTAAFWPYWARMGLLLGGLLLYVHLLVLASNLGWAVPWGPALGLGVGALLFGLGSWLARLPPNWLLGIRTPWTLQDAEVWKSTHALAGPLFQAAALATALGAILWPSVAWAFVVAPVLLAALYLVLHSYREYARRHPK